MMLKSNTKLIGGFLGLLLVVGATSSAIVGGTNLKGRKECTNIIQPILTDLQEDNGIINLKIKDNAYTMWYNSKGEVYAMDENTYYIFRDDGKMVYFGVDQDDNGDVTGGAEIVERKDFISQLLDEIKIAKDIEINSERDAGEYGTAVTKITYKSGEDDRLVEVRGTHDTYSINCCLVENGQPYTVWSFDGYYVGADWELPEEWYQDEIDDDTSQKMVVELSKAMEKKAQEVMGDECPSMGVTVNEYYNSTNPEVMYYQLIDDFEYLGYSYVLDVDLKEELEKEMSTQMQADKDGTVAKMSLFDFALQLFTQKGYIM